MKLANSHDKLLVILLIRNERKQEGNLQETESVDHSQKTKQKKTKNKGNIDKR